MDDQQQDFGTSSALSHYDLNSSWVAELWRDNYGKTLLFFFVGITAIGFALLAYRENRFVAPRFPDEGAIAQPVTGQNEEVPDSPEDPGNGRSEDEPKPLDGQTSEEPRTSD